MAEPITKGDRYEMRIARLLFWEGAFVRRAINLNVHFGEDFTVTDIDVLALRFGRDLEQRTTIGEAKTTEARNAPKATDRLLWGGGLRALVGADDNFVATTKAATERVRRLATQLGAQLIDERDVAHRESLLGIDEKTPWGPHDPALLVAQRSVYDTVKRDRDLKRVYWFVRSDFWFSDPVRGLKRALGACRLLATRISGQLPDSERQAVRWLAHQAAVTVVVATVRIAAASYRQPPAVARTRLSEQLSEGLADYHTLVELSRTVDRYMMAVLREAKVDPGSVVGALGVLSPEAPPYTEPLLEVVERLAAEPAASSQLPRLLDWRIAEVALERELGELPAPTLEVVNGDADRLLRTIGTFLTGQTKLPRELVEGVLVGVSPLRPEGEAADRQNGQAGTVAAIGVPQASSGPPAQASDGLAQSPPADTGIPPKLFAEDARQADGDALVVVGDPERFRLGEVTHTGTADEPVSVRAVAMHVRNVGAVAAQIKRADARSERHGELTFDGQSEIPPGGDDHLIFRMPADSADEGLLVGERLNVAIDYGSGKTHFVARWVGPEPDSWEVITESG